MRAGLAFQRQFEIYIPVVGLPAQFQAFTEQADQTLREQALPFDSNAFYVTGQITLAIVISIYWLTARATALRTALRAAPRQYQPTLSHFWIDTEEMLGSYFAAKLHWRWSLVFGFCRRLNYSARAECLAFSRHRRHVGIHSFHRSYRCGRARGLIGFTVSPLIRYWLASGIACPAGGGQLSGAENYE